MSFAEIMQEDMASVAADTAEQGESVTYTTRAGASSTVNAIVIREVAERDENGNFLVGVVELTIPNSSAGLTSVAVGGDTVTLARRQGGSNETMRVMRIVQQDAGGWTLRVM